MPDFSNDATLSNGLVTRETVGAEASRKLQQIAGLFAKSNAVSAVAKPDAAATIELQGSESGIAATVCNIIISLKKANAVEQHTSETVRVPAMGKMVSLASNAQLHTSETGKVELSMTHANGEHQTFFDNLREALNKQLDASDDINREIGIYCVNHSKGANSITPAGQGEIGFTAGGLNKTHAMDRAVQKLAGLGFIEGINPGRSRMAVTVMPEPGNNIAVGTNATITATEDGNKLRLTIRPTKDLTAMSKKISTLNAGNFFGHAGEAAGWSI